MAIFTKILLKTAQSTLHSNFLNVMNCLTNPSAKVYKFSEAFSKVFQNVFPIFSRNVMVAEVTIHPNYQLLTNLDTNVALLRLNETILPSHVVRPTCLPSAND